VTGQPKFGILANDLHRLAAFILFKHRAQRRMPLDHCPQGPL
jgi:hypothetical protein